MLIFWGDFDFQYSFITHWSGTFKIQGIRFLKIQNSNRKLFYFFQCVYMCISICVCLENDLNLPNSDPVYNIWEFYEDSVQFLFIISKTELMSSLINFIFSLPHELPKDSRLQISVNFDICFYVFLRDSDKIYFCTGNWAQGCVPMQCSAFPNISLISN